MSLDEWQATQIPYDEKQAIARARNKLEQSLKELTDTFTYETIQQESEKNQQLQNQIENLKTEKYKLNHILENKELEIAVLENRLENIPNEIQAKYQK